MAIHSALLPIRVNDEFHPIDWRIRTVSRSIFWYPSRMLLLDRLQLFLIVIVILFLCLVPSVSSRGNSNKLNNQIQSNRRNRYRTLAFMARPATETMQSTPPLTYTSTKVDIPVICPASSKWKMVRSGPDIVWSSVPAAPCQTRVLHFNVFSSNKWMLRLTTAAGREHNSKEGGAGRQQQSAGHSQQSRVPWSRFLAAIRFTFINPSTGGKIPAAAARCVRLRRRIFSAGARWSSHLFPAPPLILRITTTATTGGQVQQEMGWLHGYQTPASIPKRHKFWLNNVIQLFLLCWPASTTTKRPAAEKTTTCPAAAETFTTSSPTWWMCCGGRRPTTYSKSTLTCFTGWWPTEVPAGARRASCATWIYDRLFAAHPAGILLIFPEQQMGGSPRERNDVERHLFSYRNQTFIQGTNKI